MNSQTTISQLIDRSNVVLILQRQCAYSNRLRNFMRSITSDLVEIEIDCIPDSAKIQREVVDRSGVMTFPQLFIKGKYVGSALDAEALSRTGELERLLR